MSLPFLRQVAQYFQERSGLQDYCFVFPNHRSSKFFERELDLASDKVYLMPEIKTVTDFIASLSNKAVVKPVEALFLLYKCYTRIKGNENYDFDRFIYWGNVVLNDFNDVDMYLVDPEMLFKNVREYREIQSTYIDDDLKEIVSHYFNLSIDAEGDNNDNFWKNYTLEEKEKGTIKDEYLKLWQSLLQLYEDYKNELNKRNLCSLGGMYRDAVLSIKEKEFRANEKYVFVGFNMLSTSELILFKRLKEQGRALFFWDLASPAFNGADAANNGANYVKFFKKELPEPSDFTSEPVTGFPEVEVVGIPSDVGQAKYSYYLIDKLIAEGHLSGDDAINTALVLPDEGLLVPLLNSLHPSIKKCNVTMGYSLAHSDIASLMRVVAKMHNQARRDSNGEWTYYRVDVKVVLSHPIVKNYFGEESLEITRVINENNYFAVPQSVFEGTRLSLLFRSLDDVKDSDSVRKFLQQQIDFCNDVLNASHNIEDPVQPDDIDDDEKHQPEMSLQEAFLYQYIDVVNQLIDVLSVYEVPSCESSVFYLIDRLAAAFSIPFEGEPLQGMQIMGMLETRCLDFENIIILSANEGILPGKMRSNTFISDFMRRYYRMSTSRDQESMWNYYFYRLISRAKRLIMVYDTSDQAMGSGEVTRYVAQLEMVYGCHVKNTVFTTVSNTSDPVDIIMPKKGRIITALDAYRAGGSSKLSASTIKEFVNCGLMFYFHKIERLRANDSDVDFMDAGTFGDIVHESLQHLYFPDGGRNVGSEGHKVTCAAIRSFMNDKDKLAAIVEKLVNEKYLHKKTSNELVGEASIVSVAITNYAKRVLRYDIDLLGKIDSNYFMVQECEQQHNISLNYGGVDFNFTYIADRIDRLSDGSLRIVDYKTGKDETSFKSVDELFSTKETHKRGMLQLMLYCNAYALEKNLDEPIMPVIYKLRNMSETGMYYNNEQLKDYRSINGDFKLMMDDVIKSLFDEKMPFVPTTNVDTSSTPCRYCRYAEFCRR